jgi:hypothetical protein
MEDDWLAPDEPSPLTCISIDPLRGPSPSRWQWTLEPNLPVDDIGSRRKRLKRVHRGSGPELSHLDGVGAVVCTGLDDHRIRREVTSDRGVRNHVPMA